ncbi:MAG: phosphoadenylyl-sulfate reductase [Cytophagales bacterium]|nr:phosphoadenylyl-sulfate reductase [Cytophagales bacterium]
MADMDFEEIKKQILTYQSQGLKLFTTSSFQTHSIVLLHILSKIDKNIPVYFINTGYLFPETILYRNQIVSLLGLNLKSVSSHIPKSLQKDAQGRLLYVSDADYCCHINKVEPLEPVMQQYDVWINGVRADQSATRKTFKTEENAPHGVIRFHPMLDWTNMQIQRYLTEHGIPRHPLEEKGYFSIGCEPCTRKFSLDLSEREVRWYGLNKTECGLNVELISK